MKRPELVAPAFSFTVDNRLPVSATEVEIPYRHPAAYSKAPGCLPGDSSPGPPLYYWVLLPYPCQCRSGKTCALARCTSRPDTAPRLRHGVGSARSYTLR